MNAFMRIILFVFPVGIMSVTGMFLLVIIRLLTIVEECLCRAVKHIVGLAVEVFPYQEGKENEDKL